MAGSAAAATLQGTLNHNSQVRAFRGHLAGHVAGVKLVEQRHVSQDDHRDVFFARAHEPVYVFTVAQALFKKADPVKNRLTIDTAAEMNVGEGAVLGLEREIQVQSSGQRNVLNPAQHDFETGVGPEAAELQFKLSRGPLVVGIQKCDELSLGMLQGEVARRRRSLVLLMKIVAHAGQTAHDLGRIVGRTVVHHDDLKRMIALTIDTRYCLWKERCRVVGGDNHAYQIFGARHRASLSETVPETQ